MKLIIAGRDRTMDLGETLRREAELLHQGDSSRKPAWDSRRHQRLGLATGRLRRRLPERTDPAYALPGWGRYPGFQDSGPARKILVYHNITPAEYFVGIDDDVATQLRTARAALPELGRKTDAIWAVSQFDADDLQAAGLRAVSVFPLLYNPPPATLKPDWRNSPTASRRSCSWAGSRPTNGSKT